MNISFSATKEQFRNGTKDVTRRLGWLTLEEGKILTAVEKCQGLKKGEKIVPMGRIVIKRVSAEPLMAIIIHPKRADNLRPETAREGFPDLTPTQFCEMFLEMNPKTKDGKKTTINTQVTRIVFERI